MTSTLPPLVQATAGAIGSAVGNAIVFPLDLVTTRQQHGEKLSIIRTLHRIIHRRGLLQLYSGLSADTLSTLISSFLYFLIHTSLSRLNARRRPSKRYSDLALGAIAGIASKRLALPISAVCIRQQLSVSADEGFLDSLASLRKEKGTAGLFHVPVATIPLALLPSLTLYLHERIAQHVPHSHVSTFLVGALSNALATLPLYPLMLAKNLSMSSRQDRLLGPLARLWRTGELYSGLEGQLVKGVVQQGVTMLLKERVEEAVVSYYRTRKLP